MTQEITEVSVKQEDSVVREESGISNQKKTTQSQAFHFLALKSSL